MSRLDEFFHGTSKEGAKSIMKEGFINIGGGDFGRGDHFTRDITWAGEFAGFYGDPDPGRIVRASVTPKNPLIHEAFDTPKPMITKALKKAREIWPEDEAFHQKIKEGDEYAIGRMAEHLGHDAYYQPSSGLLVTKARGIARPEELINKSQFNRIRLGI